MRPQRLESIDGVGDALAIDLESTCVESGVCRRGKQRHRISVLSIGNRGILLKRRGAGRHEQDEVKRKRLPRLLRSYQVTEMDGIEGSTHNPQSIFTFRISPKLGKMRNATHRFPRHRERVRVRSRCLRTLRPQYRQGRLHMQTNSP